MSDLRKQHLIETKNTHQKRLRVLEVQAAKFGISAQPHIIIEIEEIKKKIDAIDYQLTTLGTTKESSIPKERDAAINLRLKLAAHFNIEELRTLCFDLSLDNENFPTLKEGLCRELVKYCIRSGSVAQLTKYCQQKRPNVSW